MVKSNRDLIIQYLTADINYEAVSGYIIFPTSDLNLRVIAEVRGRGSLDALIQDENGMVNPDKVQELKKELGEFIVEAIKEKLKKEK
jgi:hypothetical protein